MKSVDLSSAFENYAEDKEMYSSGFDFLYCIFLKYYTRKICEKIVVSKHLSWSHFSPVYKKKE